MGGRRGSSFRGGGMGVVKEGGRGARRGGGKGDGVRGARRGGGGGGGGRVGGRGGSGGKYGQWINNPDKVMSWMAKYDIRTLLKRNQGLVKIKDFLPSFVAEGLLDLVQGITEDEWRVTEATRDLSANNISHKFWSTKKARGLEEVTRMFSCLLPESLNTAFSAAKYQLSDHIEPHDDRAYADVAVEGGQVVQCCREIAIIYYLTEDWSEGLGGTLVDCQTGTRYVPEFNSLIAFDIPRFHEVCAVTSPQRPRYSIFGWFLSEEMLYDLNVGGEGGYGSGEVARGGGASSKGKKKQEDAAGVEEGKEAGGGVVNKKKRKGGDGEGSGGEGRGECVKKKKKKRKGGDAGGDMVDETREGLEQKKKKKRKKEEVKVEGDEGGGVRGRLKLSCVPRKKAIMPLSLVRPR